MWSILLMTIFLFLYGWIWYIFPSELLLVGLGSLIITLQIMKYYTDRDGIMDEMLKESAEDESTTETVGSIRLEELEKLFEKRGDIDWEKTISIDQFNIGVSKL